MQSTTATWLVDGGLHFNGYNNSIIINANKNLQNQYRTILIQFMWDGHFAANEDALYLYDSGWAFNGSVIIYVHPATSRLYAEFRTKTGIQQGCWIKVAPNKIYTAIFRFDGFTYSLWLNGKMKSGSLEKKGELGVNKKIGIGSNYINTRRWFSGNIYNLLVFNRSLCNTEIISICNTTLKENYRANPGSKYILAGWIASHNDTLLISQLNKDLVTINYTHVVSPDIYGNYQYVFNLPSKVNNYTYEVTQNYMDEKETVCVSIVVDQLEIYDVGSTSVWTGEEAVFWFKLRSKFDGQPVESGVVVLTGGLFATWNAGESRWEYREICSKEKVLSLRLESITWDKYGITSISPSSRNISSTVTWKRATRNDLLKYWLIKISPAISILIAIVLVLFILIHFKILAVKIGNVSELIG
ncbi:MAG: hypothetical protein ACTSQY_04615 [Candidatus Odinarchaeia archaeon]